jgi:uncharacterized protein YjgD (DUF1641 family)
VNPLDAVSQTVATTDAAAQQALLARMAAQLDELVEENRRARERWEVLDELVRDATPVARQAMGSMTDRLDALQQRGYLEFVGSGIGVVDRIVGAFGREDVEALGENVVLMLQTLREMTQPEVLGLLRRTVELAHEPTGPAVEPPSLLALAGRMRRPEIRHGLDRLLRLVEGMTAPNPATQPEEERA